MKAFHPPAFVDDFSRVPAKADQMAREWNAQVSAWMDEAAGNHADGLFFNIGTDATPGDAERQPVAWDAFPRSLVEWFKTEPRNDELATLASETLAPRVFRRVTAHVPVGEPVPPGQLGDPVAMTYRQQDEYCEWHVVPRPGGGIERVDFTAEAPEYWSFLAAHDLALVTDLYRELLGEEAIQPEELCWPYDVAAPSSGGWVSYAHRGDYNPFNHWNTTGGAVHLTHPANTLGAEVDLAAGAAVLYDGPVNAEELVCCAAFGEPNRSSDPSIGYGVNSLAANGLSISLADPVGLYMADLRIGGFAGPNGEDVSGAWQVKRGDSAQRMILRASFEVPAGAGFGVDKVTIDGTPIASGADIARRIRMTLTGAAKTIEGRTATRQLCGAKCCTKPRNPDFRTSVDPDAHCDAVDWTRYAPVLPADEHPAAPLHLAAPALALVPEEAEYATFAAAAAVAGPAVPRGLPTRLVR